LVFVGVGAIRVEVGFGERSGLYAGEPLAPLLFFQDSHRSGGLGALPHRPRRATRPRSLAGNAVKALSVPQTFFTELRNTAMTDNASSSVPNGRGFVAVLAAFRASGGTARGDVVARLLEDHDAGEAASLATLVHSSQLFGFEWRGSFWIPMFQFNPEDLSLASAAQAVRAELPELWSGWTVAMWFAMRNARLEGHSPVDLLGSDLDAVLHAAQALPSIHDMSFMHRQRPHGRAAYA